MALPIEIEEDVGKLIDRGIRLVGDGRINLLGIASIPAADIYAVYPLLFDCDFVDPSKAKVVLRIKIITENGEPRTYIYNFHTLDISSALDRAMVMKNIISILEQRFDSVVKNIHACCYEALEEGNSNER